MLIDFEFGKVQKLSKDGTGKKALTERDKKNCEQKGKHTPKTVPLSILVLLEQLMLRILIGSSFVSMIHYDRLRHTEQEQFFQ